MMRNWIPLALLLCLVVPGLAFLDVFKTAFKSAVPAPEEAVLDPTRVRGVSDQLQARYQADRFTCDNGRIVLDKSAINDGYCDCEDKSDEPGSSACNGGVFTCANKGYKPLQFASSRVDDGICDCCDGSDEGYVTRCVNTCKQAAERERSAIERMLQSYRVGSTVRQTWIQQVKEKLQKSANEYPVLYDRVEQVREEIRRWEGQLQQKEAAFNVQKQSLESDIKTEIYKLLNIHQAGHLHYLVQFLSSLMSVLDIHENELKHIVSFPVPDHFNAVSSSATADDEDHHVDEHAADSYGDDVLPDEEEHHVAPPAEAAEESCDVVQIAETGNVGEGHKLRLLCHADNKEQELVNAIYTFTKKYNAYTQIMHLLGYYQLNAHFSGSAAFSKSQIAAAGNDACPAEFEIFAQHCELKTQLNELFNRLNSIGNQLYQDPQYVSIKAEIDARQQSVRDLERQLNEADNAKSDLGKHQNHLEFLALKDQCFDVVDGKFSYSLCNLDTISQKEVDGHSTVTLGSFNQIEETTDNGASYKIKFHNGQYCHAFGARSAEVSMVCADKNALKSAREPSTCFYALVFESPAACTPKYAEANGLTHFL